MVRVVAGIFLLAGLFIGGEPTVFVTSSHSPQVQQLFNRTLMSAHQVLIINVEWLFTGEEKKDVDGFFVGKNTDTVQAFQCPPSACYANSAICCTPFTGFTLPLII